MTTLSHYQRKFWYEDLLSGTINALSFSEDARLLAVADSRGVLVTFDTGMGSPIHVAYMTPKIQVFTLLWRGVDEVFFGLSNGAVGSACFRHVGNEYRLKINRALPEDMAGPVASLALSEQARPRLAVAVRDQVHTWQLIRKDSWKKGEVYSIDNAVDYVVSMAFLKNGDLVVAYQAGGISIWTASSSTRISVPGLEVNSISHFSFALNGLALVSFETRGPNQGFTDLFRFTSQPPYGLTRVRNWPGRQKSASLSPIPVALAFSGSLHLMVWAVEKDRTAIVQSDGLTEQFEPSLPIGCEGELLRHLEGSQTEGLTCKLTSGNGYVAAIVSTTDTLRLELWSTNPSAIVSSSLDVKQDNLSHLLWKHIKRRRRTYWCIRCCQITVLVLVLLAASITLFLGCDTRFQVSKSWCFSRPSILEPIQRRVSSAKIFKQSTKWGKALWKSWMPTLHDDDAPWLRDEPDSRVESSASAETFSGYATDLDTMQNVDLKVLMANLRRIVGSGTGDRADDQMETCPASPTPYCAALIFSS